MKKFIFAIVLLPTIALAQSQPPVEYNIKLTAPEVDIVGKALGKMSYEEVALLIQKLREQIVSQQSNNKPVDEKDKK